jgi:hypothetical protein
VGGGVATERGGGGGVVSGLNAKPVIPI